jgi:hypothetical protein
MGKKLAAVQSSYIPWKGYFDLMHAVDEFVLFDNVQYTRRDWRSRNRIKTREGLRWLTVPVCAKGNYLAPIKSITVSEADWAERHWKTLVGAYGRAACFRQYEERFANAYLDLHETSLSGINRRLIERVAGALGITTRLSWSMDYELVPGKNERLLALCRQAGADVYVSGPSARHYIDEELFRREGVAVEFFDYSGYPEYPQLHPPFEHQVSVLDLLFNTGADAPRHMLTFGAVPVSTVR